MAPVQEIQAGHVDEPAVEFAAAGEAVFHFPSGLKSNAGSSTRSPRIDVLIMAIISMANCRVGLKAANMNGTIEQQLISIV
jgi:hypothetical protein